MKILIIESVAATPHIETSGEIALRLKEQGHDVNFNWVGFDLPWTDWDLSPVAKMIGGSYEKKINKFSKILIEKNITVDKFDFPINQNKISKWAKNFNGNIKNLKKYRYDNYILGASVASSLISKYQNVNINLNDKLDKVYSLLYSSALVYERSKFAIKKINPEKIYTFNNRFATTYPIICSAKKLKKEISIHERGSDINKFEIYDRDAHDIKLIKRKINYYWNKNKNKNKISLAHKYFQNKKLNKNYENKNIVNFTKNQIKDLIPKLPNNKRIVTFFTSRDYEKASLVDQEFDQLKAFKEFKKIIQNYKDIHLVIRVHPSTKKIASDDDLEWLKFKDKNTTVIHSIEKIDSYALMFRSDIVTTYTSSMIVEASYFNKPTIAIGNFWWSGKGIVNEPKTSDELKKLLKENYKYKKRNLLECLKVANYILNYGTGYKYYSPITQQKGFFLGEILSWKPKYIRILEDILNFISYKKAR